MSLFSYRWSPDNPSREEFILLTSSGPSAEYQGSALGLYKRVGIHNNSPFYRHVDTVTGGGQYGDFELVYRNNVGKWFMGNGMDMGGHGLQNESNTGSVPLTGWKCWNSDASFGDKDHWWLEDPYLRISHDFPSPCGDIIIAFEGSVDPKITKKKIKNSLTSECVGVYSPTDMFSAGRRVFKHKSKKSYLLVLGYTHWVVKKKVNTMKSEGIYMASGSAPSMCPADIRAKTSEREGQTSWRYLEEGEWKQGNITVMCSNHYGNPRECNFKQDIQEDLGAKKNESGSGQKETNPDEETKKEDGKDQRPWQKQKKTGSKKKNNF